MELNRVCPPLTGPAAIRLAASQMYLQNFYGVQTPDPTFRPCLGEARMLSGSQNYFHACCLRSPLQSTRAEMQGEGNGRGGGGGQAAEEAEWLARDGWSGRKHNKRTEQALGM